MSLAFTFPQRLSLRVISVSMVLFALVFIASCTKDEDTTDTPTDNNPPATLGQPGAGGTDQEGNAFASVIIGSQEWMSENLSVASYSDGTPIPHVTDSDEWMALSTGAWTNALNGRLYNWYAVAGIYDEASAANPALRKQLAPMGWHVPSDSEWSTMINFLDPAADGGANYNVVGGMMKTTGTNQDGTGLWNAPNTMANNLSGFSGNPTGYLTQIGYFEQPYSVGFWWSSTEYNIDFAWNRNLNYENGSVSRRGDIEKRFGFSVRCIRD
jgi:uncharacterized protein (TIGR02145 family)